MVSILQYKHSEKEFTIPDINSGFIAQGLTYDARSDCFFMTGYMNDKSASPIYMVEKSTNKYVKKLLMQNPDGSEFHGHAGGMTVHGDYIYVAGSGDSCLYVFLYKDANLTISLKSQVANSSSSILLSSNSNSFSSLIL